MQHLINLRKNNLKKLADDISQEQTRLNKIADDQAKVQRERDILSFDIQMKEIEIKRNVVSL